MKSISEFKDWLKRMEQYETISGSTAEKVLEFVENQQKEMDLLKSSNVKKVIRKLLF